eukprot:4983201-Amphidinium_carterae.1
MMQVPHLTADHVQQLKKAKLTGLSSLLDMPADKRRAKLEAIGLGAPALADIDEFVAVGGSVLACAGLATCRHPQPWEAVSIAQKRFPVTLLCCSLSSPALHTQ